MRFRPLASAVLAALAVTAAVACHVEPPVGPNLTVPADGAQVCGAHCATMGLALGGVVLVSNRMGCVCVPAAPTSPGGAPGAVSLVEGAAAVTGLSDAADDDAASAYMPGS
ncbi:MAG TPA: hypothetical protein VHE35_15585, partial [Kofleriaceae bacterium]|nr:hypothetical protein [Kofleriaceae bacterium]